MNVLNKERSEKISKLGKAGEAIVVNKAIERGQKVVYSVDQYDREKDMLIDGKKIEVKTQVPFCKFDAFTVKPNQLKKLQEADGIYWLSVPNKERPHSSEGNVFYMEEKFEWKEITTRDCRDMIMIPIAQLPFDWEMTQEQKDILQKLSISAYNR